MRRRTLLILALLLSVSTLGAAQRLQTYEQLTVADAAVTITAATMTNMRAGQGVLQGAEIRYRCDGTAPTTTVGTPLQVGGTLNFPNVIDARACQFIRTTATDGVLNLNFWQ